MLIIAFLIIFISSVTCFYYIRLIKLIFFANVYKSIFWSGLGFYPAELLIVFASSVVLTFLVRPNTLSSAAAVISASALV